MSEIVFIVKHIPGITADYIERKPVQVRKKLVNDILKELESSRDGSKGIPHNHKPAK